MPKVADTMLRSHVPGLAGSLAWPTREDSCDACSMHHEQEKHSIGIPVHPGDAFPIEPAPAEHHRGGSIGSHIAVRAGIEGFARAVG